jgi:hypothetical protein
LITQLDPAVDYLVCDQGLLVGSDKRVYDRHEHDSAQLDWQPRALAEYRVAGDGGHIGIYTLGTGGDI